MIKMHDVYIYIYIYIYIHKPKGELIKTELILSTSVEILSYLYVFFEI